MRVGLIIIGDEILSGKRRDRHFAEAILPLRERCMELSWRRIIGDEPALIEDSLRQTMASPDLVFCFGGIGATPDDHTRACAARAAGGPLARHPDAVAEMEARFGPGLTPARLLLAELPVGSRIIPNPYNRVAGFSVGHHHFLPGFPEMAWPMLCWVLDTQYPELRRSRPAMERVLRVRAREGELLELMQAFVERYPTCRFSSLPELGQEPWLERGVRGEEAVVEDGVRFWRTALSGRGIRWEERQPKQRGADDEGTRVVVVVVIGCGCVLCAVRVSGLSVFARRCASF